MSVFPRLLLFYRYRVSGCFSATRVKKKKTPRASELEKLLSIALAFIAKKSTSQSGWLRGRGGFADARVTHSEQKPLLSPLYAHRGHGHGVDTHTLPLELVICQLLGNRSSPAPPWQSSAGRPSAGVVLGLDVGFLLRPFRRTLTMALEGPPSVGRDGLWPAVCLGSKCCLLPTMAQRIEQRRHTHKPIPKTALRCEDASSRIKMCRQGYH
jgi:hypothetical protein